MIKKLFLIVLACLSLGSCNQKSSDETPGDFNVSYVDYSNHETIFTNKPKNVAVLFSSYAQIWTSVGGKIKVTVGDSIKRGFVKEEDVISVGTGPGNVINNELLIASNPDLVIVTADLSGQVSTGELTRSQGINTLILKEESFEDYLKILKLFSDLNENKNSYQELGIDVKNKIENIKLLAPNQDDKDYLFIRSGSTKNSLKVKTSKDHFGCVIFDDLHGQNVADDMTLVNDTVSLEQLIVANPSKIVIVAQGDEEAMKSFINDLFKSEGWSEIKAVKNNKIYFLDKELFSYKPNQKWNEAYQVAYDILNKK